MDSGDTDAQERGQKASGRSRDDREHRRSRCVSSGSDAGVQGSRAVREVDRETAVQKSRTGKKRKHHSSVSTSSDSSCSDSERSLSPRSKKKRRKHSKANGRAKKKSTHNSSTSDDSDSNSSCDSPPPPPPPKKPKRKSKSNDRHKSHKHKSKHQKHELTKKESKTHRKIKDLPSVPPIKSTSGLQGASESVATSNVKALIQKSSKSKGPMTREEYEKQQSVVRRVFDPDTGRHRLVKGDGEIVEEIVSRERQKAINKQATVGDGRSFQAGLAKLF